MKIIQPIEINEINEFKLFAAKQHLGEKWLLHPIHQVKKTPYVSILKESLCQSHTL
jgi:hypothetical protein